MTRWQRIRLDMVLATARLLGVPLRLHDAPPAEGAGAAGRTSGSGKPRAGKGHFGKERRQLGRVVSFRKPGEPGEPEEALSIEDILRKA